MRDKQKEKEDDKELIGLIKKGSQIKAPEQVWQTKVRRIDAFGDFTQASQESGEPYTVSDAMKSAENLVKEHGLKPNQEVTIITEDKGKKVEKKMTLERMSSLRKGDSLYKKLKKDGGWVKFGDEGPDKETVKAVVGGTLLKAAGIIAEKVEEGEIPDSQKKKAAEVVAKCIREWDSIQDQGLDQTRATEAFGALGMTGGSPGGGIYQPFSRYTVGIPWDYIDTQSRIMAAWWFDNVKWRSQYSIVGKYVSLPWAITKYGKKNKKKKKKWKKKVRKFEKMFDLFYINIEDVFDLDNLSIWDIFELEDYGKTKPTGKQYESIKKLMKEQGYFKEQEAIKAAEITRTPQTSDIFKKP
ncbi:MAG: hypothetical protein V1921_01995 [Candidatus Altiarchaeota archaeon]